MEPQIIDPPMVAARQILPEPGPTVDTAPVVIPTPDDLDVPLPLWLGMGVLLSAVVIAALIPNRTSYLGILMLERGFTQFASLYLASATFAFLFVKALRLARARARLHEAARLPLLPAVLDAEQARTIRQAWVRAGTAPALRRARALQAYAVAGSRSAAAGRAEEDAVFAQSAMEQSYALPRALVWAIPLMGFIGTVVGIGAAVAGFSGFLARAEEIEQIKSGIGAVTTGLAVAFDTTLVALALSVAVMLPLVLLERLEGQLLMALEADVGDAVVGRLPDAPAVPELDRAAMAEVVSAVFDIRLPEPAAIVRVAEPYLRQAAEAVAREAHQAAAGVAEVANTLRLHHERTAAALEAAEERMQERMAERDAASAQALAAVTAAAEQSAHAAVQEMRTHAQQVATGLAQHAATIAQSLDRVGVTLQQRADALERQSAGLNEVVELERSLHRTLRGLEETGELRRVLAGVDGSLRGLQPVLDRLSQPRRILLMEAEDGR